MRPKCARTVPSLGTDVNVNAKPVAIVFGSSGAIANALIDLWSTADDYKVIAVGRSDTAREGVQSLLTDYSERSLQEVAERVAEIGGDIRRLVITNGVLSGEGFRPERKVGDLQASAWSHVMNVNALLPLQILSAFWPLVRKADQPRLAVLSARVGSLGDNALGGWYSYRASKAALNMMLKCAAIEARRINKTAKLIAYHPGTVESALSKPFQRSVPEGKLFSPEFTAARLEGVMASAVADGKLSYLDWAGETINW